MAKYVVSLFDCEKNLLVESLPIELELVPDVILELLDRDPKYGDFITIKKVEN